MYVSLLTQVERAIHALQASLDDKERELDALDADVAKKTAENKALYDSAVRFREVIGRADALEERLALYTENCDALAAGTTLLDASEAQLEAQLASLPAELEAQQARLNTLHSELDEAKAARDAASAEHERLLRAHGEQVAAQRALERTRDAARTELRALAHEYALEVPDRSEDAIDTLCAATQSQLAAHARAADAADAQQERAAREREAELEHAWQERRSALRDVQAQHAQRAESLARLDERIAACDAELTPEAAEAPGEALDTLRARHAALAAQLDAPDAAQARTDADAARRALEARRDTLGRTLLASTHVVEQRAVLAQHEHARDEHAAELERRMARLAPDAERLLGHTAEASALAAEAAAAAAAQEASLTRARAAQQEQQRAHDRAAAALEVHDARLAEAEARVAPAAPDAAALAEELRAAREEVHILQDSLAVLEHAAEFFQRIRTAGVEKHVCIGCNRGIPDAAMPAFEAHVAASMQRSAPERVAGLRADLDAWNAQVAQLEDAQRACDERARHADALPPLRARRAELAREQQAAAAALRAADGAAHEADARFHALHALAEQAARAREQQDALERVAALAAAARADLRLDGGVPRADDVRRELDALAADLQARTDEHAALVREHERVRDAHAAAERALHAAEMAHAAAQRQDAAREAARRRRAELVSDREAACGAQAALAREMDAAAAPIAAAQRALDAFCAERRAADDAARTAREARRAAAQRVADVRARLAAAAADAPEGDALDAPLAAAVAARDARAAAVASAEAEAHRLAMALRDAQATEARLRDNVRYRQLQRERARVADELAALDLDGARAGHAEFAARYDAARRAENELSGAAAHLRGELRGLASEKARREAELASEYADVHARYVRQLIHLKVAGLANRDLETYSGALHQAILQYHAIKMEEVNQTLDYLWKKTYQGTDVDTILIRSDTDGKVNASGLRSYQYRVCMVKDGVELEMRGRCSAGQKVLACILVRLALADSFAANCGFLALDEPTTNLDRENVEALAASLVDLIAERRHQRNFQLVVITHDEDFLSRLCQSDALTQYWRVSRDAELVRADEKLTQHSMIEREYVRSI